MSLIVAPEPMLVDALGNPLRSEPEPTGTFVSPEHAALEREAMEAAVRDLLPRPLPEPDPFRIRFSPSRLVPLLPFRIADVLDDAAPTDQAGPEPAEGEPHP